MEKRLLDVSEAAAMLDLGRSKTYALVMGGQLRSIRIGRARRIPVEAIDEFIRTCLSEQQGSADDGSTEP